MNVESPIPSVDEILADHRDNLGGSFLAYRNHVCRVLNYCFALRRHSAEGDCSDEEKTKLTIAGCFHDLGIWPSGSLDYLAPSIGLANAYLDRIEQQDWAAEVGRIIDLHHKFRSVRGDDSPLVELFRRSDLIDVSLGIQTFGLPRSFIKEVGQAFPNEGFHKTLVRLGARQFLKSPWNPLPMFKW